VRHQIVRFGLRQAFLDRALDANQTRPELVLGQLTDRANAAITQMVDVIDFAAAIAQLHQQLDDFNNIPG